MYAFLNLICATQIIYGVKVRHTIQVTITYSPTEFTSQSKSSPVPINDDRKEIAPKTVVTIIAATGTPYLEVFPRNLGP
jgi:hypothetical protein